MRYVFRGGNFILFCMLFSRFLEYGIVENFEVV